MDEAAQEAGIEVNLDPTYEMVSFPDGHLIKRFEVITPVVEADTVFNLAKLKTHLYTGMTGAVKNLFGVIPGLAKPGYHSKLRDPSRFADMLLDLTAHVAPRLSVMDGVVGMEGDGPANGVSRHIGLLFAARNSLALDIVASEIMGLERRNNPVLLAAEKRGLVPNCIEQVEVVGASIEELRISDFKVPVTVSGGVGFESLPGWQRRLLVPLFKRGMTLRPRVVKPKCVACGACRTACPVQAIAMVDGRCAQIDDEECIRCYCCHEMCPEDAIELEQNLLYRFVNAG
jgi:ferredoxin